MTAERQAYALAHPITDPSTVGFVQYGRTEAQHDGNLLQSILAVDR